jgi:hypothetical protein
MANRSSGKKGYPRIDSNRSGDFFLPGPSMQHEGGNMDRREIAYLKQTILLIRDWDGFQIAMRRGL